MSNASTLGVLTEVFRDVFDDDSLVISNSTSAEEIPDWDSQNHVQLILAIEQRFRIRFRTAEIETLKSVGDLVALIDRKVAHAGS
jgi:acyl carrier protein